MGYKFAVLSHGPTKRGHATSLGAHVYIVTSAEGCVGKLQELGDAAMIVATGPDLKLAQPLVNGLQPGGKLHLFSPAGDLPINTLHLINGGCSVTGRPNGHVIDSEEAITFARDHNVKCMIGKSLFEKTPEASAHMLLGKVRHDCLKILVFCRDQTSSYLNNWL